MREHMGLYRGKRLDNGEWVEGFYRHDKVGEYLTDVFIAEPLTSRVWETHRVDLDTVGECTGLRDKNGKLIFEGDMCCNTRTGEIVSVKWHGTMAGFVWSKRKEKSNLFDFGELFRAHDKYEIIGNIHDNPELVKGGDLE